MSKIERAHIRNDFEYRFGYLTEDRGFGPDDIEAILRSEQLLVRSIPSMVDAVYTKYFTDDAFWRRLVSTNSGYDGYGPQSFENLHPDHETIAFRRYRLGRYLTRLVTGPYNDKMVASLDFVGKVHFDRGTSRENTVPRVEVHALIGFVADALSNAILNFDISVEEKAAALRAFSKVLWLQYDLIANNYHWRAFEASSKNETGQIGVLHPCNPQHLATTTRAEYSLKLS